MAVAIQKVHVRVRGIDMVVDVAPKKKPEPVPVPEGTFYNATSRGEYGRVWNDLYLLGHSRTVEDRGIQFTNMIQAASELFYKDGKIRAKGKPTVDVRHSPWWDLLGQWMGEVVRERFQVDGYGIISEFMDNGPDNLYGLFCGGNVVHWLGDILTADGKMGIIEANDYDAPIVHTDPKKAPHLHVKQNLVSSTASRDYNELVDKGKIGGNGDIWFPMLTKVDDYVRHVYGLPVVGLEKYKIAFFPRPPFECELLAESAIVDNVIQDVTGVKVTVSELCFYGSNVYGRVDADWYVLDEMLVRGDPAYPALHGDMDDSRVYVGKVYSENKKWLEMLPPGVPEIGWTYRHKPEGYEW